MTKIIFITSDDSKHIVQADIGMSIMESARRANVPGIVAECGGACTCATCHIYVDSDWSSVVGDGNEFEREMLEFVDNVQPHSRLSCQIKVVAELDGLTVRVPAS